MYLEEVILEGFKSYATRTVISNWDPEFNAITGLNGSGKSNILDAICFVLGISNLKQVRVSSLNEFVYKKGQAGITKASVTLVFNNEDPFNSPVGYDQMKKLFIRRQIVVGGKNKYEINGHTAQANQIANLFQSVQLNVNNPHFLIMQGRVTKVLNMKPPEILAMIEEAAGTRMFEDRKSSAQKTMAKKERKVEEITTVLTEDITPKLDQLRGQKSELLEYQKIESEIERLSRRDVAYEYYINKRKFEESEEDLTKNVNSIEVLKKQTTALDNEVEELHRKLMQLSNSKKKESDEGGKYQGAVIKAKEVSKELVKANTQFDIKEKSIQEEEGNLKSLIKTFDEAKRLFLGTEAKMSAEEKKFQLLAEEYTGFSGKVRELEELVQTLTTGMCAEEGHESGYTKQLQDRKAQIKNLSTEMKQAEIKLKHIVKERAVLEKKLNKVSNEHRILLKEQQELLKEKQKFESKLEEVNLDSNQESNLKTLIISKESQIQELEKELEELERRTISLSFNFSDPFPGFDRSKVKGLIAELIRIDQDQLHKSTAIEITAGGRLYNLVVESDSVGSQLLQHGKLRKRVTIIPINKIQASIASHERVVTAKKIAPNKVSLALDLVDCENEVRKAIEYVFGNTLVCDDEESARKVTFNKQVHMRSVTLEGDLYDPSGKLQGGSNANNSGVLTSLQRKQVVCKELEMMKSQLQDLNEQMSAFLQSKKNLEVYQEKLQLTLHKLEALDEQISSSTYQQVTDQLEGFSTETKNLEEVIEKCLKNKEETEAACAKLEQDIEDFSDHRDQKIKEVEKELATEMKRFSKLELTYKEKKKILDDLAFEKEEAKNEISSLENQIHDSEAALQIMKEESHSLEQKVDELKKMLEEVNNVMKVEQSKFASYDGDMKKLEVAIEKNKSMISDNNLKVKKLSHNVERYQKDTQQAKDIVLTLKKSHKWIPEIEEQLGVAGSAFDFEGQDFQNVKKQLKHLEDRHEALRKKVNREVLNTLESVEKRETSLKQMLTTVKKDKRKIEHTIDSLDNFKNEKLESTWEKVNRDFGSIFSDLLPGNTAKLEPPEGKTVMDGLEVKVKLGSVWKQSLTELSGGQRSLIALSLILSLLQFKPAPMYILDEVDAALDLSHTQHIGTLLKTRFKGSQFIVVSLKDGMFNNANVLFRARFKDGVSSVERMAQKSSTEKQRKK